MSSTCTLTGDRITEINIIIILLTQLTCFFILVGLIVLFIILISVPMAMLGVGK